MKETQLCEHFCSECGFRLAHGSPYIQEEQHRLGRHINDHWNLACRNADGSYKDEAVKPK